MQKKYIIFDLDGTLIRSNSQVDQIVFDYIAEHIDPEQVEYARYLFDNFGGISNKEVLEKI
jgi:hydroxymethylpyrimidine pyrophosphatase-like HAD family hydrolase